jgi:hypothetical protein
MGLLWNSKLSEHKMIRGARSWATGGQPGYDECQACGKKLRRHRKVFGDYRVCSPNCAQFMVAHWK